MFEFNVSYGRTGWIERNAFNVKYVVERIGTFAYSGRSV
jgi:hypothetical protein